MSAGGPYLLPIVEEGLLDWCSVTCQLDNIQNGLNILSMLAVCCTDCVVDTVSHCITVYHSNNPNIHTEYNTVLCHPNISDFE